MQNRLVNKQMMFEHFAGRETPLQKVQIEEWLATADNRELYFEWLDEWENANRQFQADEKAAFKKIFNDPVDETSFAKSGKQGKFLFSRILPGKIVAAAVLLIFIGSLLFFFKEAILYKSVQTNFGEVKAVKLPDGTDVVLNANSILRYSRFRFSGSVRRVLLTGEADFSVVHTKSNSKFYIQTSTGLNIQVLGTQFTVYARPAKTSVVLRNGKVELSYKTGKNEHKVDMKPGDLFTMKENYRPQLQRTDAPENLSAWKTNDFVFDGTALSEIGSVLQENYNIKVRFIQPSTAKRKITGTVHANNAEELIDVISELMGINYKIKADTVYFIP